MPGTRSGRTASLATATRPWHRTPTQSAPRAARSPPWLRAPPRNTSSTLTPAPLAAVAAIPACQDASSAR
jgi:hypothetical protein